MTYAIRNKRGEVVRELPSDRIEAWGIWDAYAKGIRVTVGDELLMHDAERGWVVLAYVGPSRAARGSGFSAGELGAKHARKRARRAA